MRQLKFPARRAGCGVQFLTESLQALKGRSVRHISILEGIHFSTLRQLVRHWAHEVEGANQVGLEIAAGHDRVQHAVFQQELRPLESLRQLLSNRLLDDSRTRKAYQEIGRASCRERE